jgi:hypothetical protein
MDCLMQIYQQYVVWFWGCKMRVCFYNVHTHTQTGRVV